MSTIITASEGPTLQKAAYRALQSVLLVSTAVLLALHFVHLSADFPNFSQWIDWAKYTDEGWYGDAAIRHFQIGHWYVPGAFNPAVALPVWPLLEAIVFRFTGVSLVAARALTVAIFAASVAAAWLLVWQSVRRAQLARAQAGLAASAAALMLAANPFCFAFSRLAILEPLMVLFMLLALLTVTQARCADGSARAELRRNWIIIVALGLLIPLMVLTKTTAVALLPALFWMLFAALNYRFRSLVTIGGAAAGLGLALWSIYFFLFVRPHYLADYRYLFDANKYTFLLRSQLGSVLTETAKHADAIGTPLYFTGCVCVCLAMVMLRRLGRHPIVPALLLWIAGYMGFLVYHNNPQPRYFYVLALPMTLLVVTVIAQLLLPWVTAAGVQSSLAIGAASALLLAIIASETVQTVAFVAHPEYTFVRAAQQIRAVIKSAERRNPGHSRLLLSISGSELSFITGLPSICDDFGTLELPDELDLYNPGWYLAWNYVEDDKMEAIAPRYRLVRVASFAALDDPERNLLVLYRLDPKAANQTGKAPDSSPRSRHRPHRRDLLQRDMKH